MAAEKGTKMSRYRFVIIGAGWRAQYYVRIAKALPDLFELCAMYCRNEEKARRISSEFGVNAVSSEDECAAMKPDFVVTAVSKTSGPEVAVRWLEKGFTVLCETPAGLDMETLNDLWMRYKNGQKIVVAEQYFLYPYYSTLLKLTRKGLIGDVHSLNISLAHEYHGASLIRAFLGITPDTEFTVSAKTYEFSVTETRNRYEVFTDERIALKKRTVAAFGFTGGKTAFYDFDSEQYHSTIRKNFYKIRGTRGEISEDGAVSLNAENAAVNAGLRMETRRIERKSDNPNLQSEDEVTGIFFEGKQLYAPPFGLYGLSQDETAIAQLMKGTAEYAAGISGSPYPLEEALQDAYMAILMKSSDVNGISVKSERQMWM